MRLTTEASPPKEIFPFFADWLCGTLTLSELKRLAAQAQQTASSIWQNLIGLPFEERPTEEIALADLLYEFLVGLRAT